MSGGYEWIFYLKLTKNLSREFFFLDQELKRTGKTLIPVGMKTLLEYVKRSHTTHVIILVKSVQELEYFNRKVRKPMRILMASRRVHLYCGSSFLAINDPGLMKRDYYYFAKLPVHTSSFCQAISCEIDRKETSVLKWPGGTRPRLSITG